MTGPDESISAASAEEMASHYRRQDAAMDRWAEGYGERAHAAPTRCER